MAGKSFKLDNFSTDWNLVTENSKRTLSLNERSTTGAPGLETGEYDRVLRVLAEADDVVQDAAAGQHAAGGDDDLRGGQPIQRFRFLDRADSLGEVKHGLAIIPAHAMLAVMPMIDVGRVGAHGCIKIDWHVRDFSTFAQPRYLKHNPLDPSDSECRHEDCPSPAHNLIDDLGQFGLGIDRRMRAIAISRLGYEYVCSRKSIGTAHHRVCRPPDIAAEMEDAPVDGQPYRCRAQQVPSRYKARRYAVAHIERRIERNRIEMPERGLRIIQRVKRLRVAMLRKGLAPCISGFLFLQMPAVG